MKLLNAKVEETYRHLKTGEIFKEKKDWEATVSYTHLTLPTNREV